MLHVILMILKIIGLILAGIAALFLLILLTVLLVPVRYRAQVKKNGELNVRAGISWLLHILHISAVYESSGLELKIRVFGIPIIKRSLLGKEKAADTETGNTIAGSSTGGNTTAEHAEVSTTVVKSTVSDIAETVVTETEKTEKSVVEAVVTETDKTEKDAVEAKKAAGTKEIHTKSDDVKTDDVKEESVEGDSIKQTGTEAVNKIKKKKKAKVKEKPSKLKSIVGKLEKIYNKFNYVTEVIKDPHTKKALKFVKKGLKRILKELLPRKLKGRVEFGFENPSLTGKVLAFCAATYGVYGDKVKIRPVFEEACFECDAYIKGAIRFGVIVRIAVAALLNRNIKFVRKKMEEL